MMNLANLENIIRWIGLAGTIFVLAVLFWGIGKGIKHPLQPGKGLAPKLLRSYFFYLVTSILYFGLCYLLWIPLPIQLTGIAQLIALIIGSLLFIGGLGLILWGRLTLGHFYNVSTSQGAPLYADHQLITSGPFAYVRHPMYMGILITGIGGHSALPYLDNGILCSQLSRSVGACPAGRECAGQAIWSTVVGLL